MSLKTGKEEIVYLLTQVFAKYEKLTGIEVKRNTNRKNYEELARVLSEISNRLPETAETLGHDPYSPDRHSKNSTYPNLKYDITGGQIKDAWNGMVSNPRPFLVDACYIYLYGMGRKAFEQQPADQALVEAQCNEPVLKHTSSHFKPKFWRIAALLLLICCITLAYYSYKINNKIDVLTHDMKIGVYKPTLPEITKLVGTWLVYIGSPQARRSEKNRYHQIVTNIIDVHFKDGYFLFKRYGANFNHEGFMQYENSDVVSIHSYVSNERNEIESPRLSLMRLNSGNKYTSVISASWNFDTGEYNDVIGIREVYMKIADQAETKEVLNTIENSSCKCKIVNLKQGATNKKYYLKNVLLDSLPDQKLRKLLDEKSILLRNPDSTVVLMN